MLGAIIGDIVGSRFEGRPIKHKDFTLFTPESRYTGVSVLSVAVADSLFHGGSFEHNFRVYVRRYPKAGYPEGFKEWAMDPDSLPRPSSDNAAAVRVGPVGWAHAELSAVRETAKRCTMVSHDHPDAMAGAQAVAATVFLSRAGKTKTWIKQFLEKRFGYDLSRSLAQVRETHALDNTCPGSVPEAIIAFLESSSLEDAVRNAVSLGGDASAQAAMAGAMAEAFFMEIPRPLAGETFRRLDEAMCGVVHGFHGHCCAKQVKFLQVAPPEPEPEPAETPAPPPKTKASPPPPVLEAPSAVSPAPAFFVASDAPRYPTYIEGPVLVIGDVHGQSKALMELIKQAWQLVPDMSERWVVFLGDFIDRGPDPKGVLDIVLTLMRRHFKTTGVMGNHELTCSRAMGYLPTPAQSNAALADLSDSMATLSKGKPRLRSPKQRYLSAYSPATTFSSFGVEQGDMEGLARAMGPGRLKLITGLPWLVEHPEYLFVHAGLVRSLGVEEQLAVLRARDFGASRPPWLHDHSLGLSGPPAACERLVVSGHSPQTKVIKGQGRILVDTSRGRKLTAVLLPEGKALEQDFP